MFIESVCLCLFSFLLTGSLFKFKVFRLSFLKMVRACHKPVAFKTNKQLLLTKSLMLCAAALMQKKKNNSNNYIAAIKNPTKIYILYFKSWSLLFCFLFVPTEIFFKQKVVKLFPSFLMLILCYTKHQ